MDDLDVGREQDPPAARADRGAEVDILGVHEIALVEQADGLGVRAPHQQARAADPVGILRAGASVAVDDASLRASALLPQLVRAARSSGRTTARRARRRPPAADRRRRRPDRGRARASSRSIAPGGTIVSLFSSRSVGAAAGADADVVAAREAEVRAGLDHADARPPPRARRRCRRSMRCRRR